MDTSSPSARREVRIGGAGIAGLTCAICLARAGRPVTVFERTDAVGAHHHGDIEYLENWSQDEDTLAELRRIGLEVNFWVEPLQHLSVFPPGWQGRFDARSATPLGYATVRGPFEGAIDRGLADQARAAGVRIVTGRSVSASEVDVIATGGARASAVASGYVFESGAPDQVTMLIDDRLTPKGYAYAIVSRGRGCLIVATTEQYKQVNRRLEQAVLEFERIAPLAPRNLRRVSYVATANLRPRRAQSRDGKLYLGEAAGFQDALLGFGMRYAILSGYLAACSLLEGQDYDALWQARFGDLLRISALNRLFFQTFGSNRLYRILLSRIAARSADTHAVLRWWYRPARWKAVANSLLDPLMKRAGARLWGDPFAHSSLWPDDWPDSRLHERR